MVFKDDLIANLRKGDKKSKGSNSIENGLIRQLENEREARLAQQSRILKKKGGGRE